MAVYDGTKDSQSIIKNATNTSRFSLAAACLPPLLQVLRLVGVGFRKKHSKQNGMDSAQIKWIVHK